MACPLTFVARSIFQAPWDKILQSTDGIAASHQLFSQRIEKDVEQPLRNFQNKKEMQNIHTISVNLQTMARELDDAADKSDRLSKKGGRANAQKVDQAASRLESATQQWESQAPFVFETLQALDEQRINHLRDVLTQFETHAVDQATRTQSAAEEVLNVMLEVETAQEIQNFVQRTTAGRPAVERRSTTTTTATRQPTPVTPSNPAPPSITGDDISEHSGHRENNPPGTFWTTTNPFGTCADLQKQNRGCAAVLEPCWAADVKVSMAASASLAARPRRALAASPAAWAAATARRSLPGPRLTT